MKLHSTSSTRISLNSLANLSRGQFTTEDVEAQERKVLAALDWKLHPPTPMCFLIQFVRLLPTLDRMDLFEMALYQAQQAVCDTYFVTVPSSTVALAALWKVLEERTKKHDKDELLPGFLHNLERLVGIRPWTSEVQDAKRRMEKMMNIPAIVEDDDEQTPRARASPVSVEYAHHTIPICTVIADEDDTDDDDDDE